VAQKWPFRPKNTKRYHRALDPVFVKWLKKVILGVPTHKTPKTPKTPVFGVFGVFGHFFKKGPKD
jgi:hypothetical protein